VATVTAGGLVAALATGATNVSATYQGQTASVAVSVANLSVTTLPCPTGITPHGSMSATINGVAWVAGCVSAAELVAGTGALHISGTDNFSLVGQALDIVLSKPGVGTFSVGGASPLVAQLLVGSGSGATWSSASGGGTVTVNALTSTGASGSFSFTLQAAGSVAIGTKAIANGTFDVTF
jgi:hypothetical protein